MVETLSCEPLYMCPECHFGVEHNYKGSDCLVMMFPASVIIGQFILVSCSRVSNQMNWVLSVLSFSRFWRHPITDLINADKAVNASLQVWISLSGADQSTGPFAYFLKAWDFIMTCKVADKLLNKLLSLYETRTSRVWRKFVINAFHQDLKDSILCTDSTVLVNIYNKILSELLDKHAPETTTMQRPRKSDV